jgi:hypothetical protein
MVADLGVRPKHLQSAYCYRNSATIVEEPAKSQRARLHFSNPRFAANLSHKNLQIIDHGDYRGSHRPKHY